MDGDNSLADDRFDNVRSKSDIVDYTQTLLDLCYPGWDGDQEGRPPILVTVCFDHIKSYVGPRSPDAHGYRKKLAERKHWQGQIEGDAAEQIFHDSMRSLTIGGVVIANFQWQQMRKELKLEDSTIGDNETDFLILHPQLGIYAVEVKASSKITTKKHGKKQKAEKQLKTFSNDIFKIYERMTGTQLGDHKYCGAGFFVPHSDLQYNSTTRSIYQPQVIDHIPHIGSENEEFEKFWDEKILLSVQQHGKRNLFVEPDFRTFLLNVVGYRSETFIAGPKYSAELAQKHLITQSYYPFSKRKETEQQNQSVARRFKWYEEGCGPDIFLTEEQCRILECSDQLQLICGAPGTGKTIVLLMKALMAAKEERSGRVVIDTWRDFEPRVKRFMDSYAFDLKRPIVFRLEELPKEEDDVFRDELGPNGLQFLLSRAQKRNTGLTVVVFTGSINVGECNQELSHIWEVISSSRAERIYTKHNLTTIMRNTKNIAAFWMKECETLNPIGHDYDGEPVVHKQFLLVSQVLEEVAEKLRTLLLVHKVSRRSIAIIGPNKGEIKQMLNFLKPLFPGNEDDEDRLRFGSAKQYAEGEAVVTVDKHTAVLSQEWVFVIAFSLICADFNENFRVTSFSRAISSLFFFERNYAEIQRGITQAADGQMNSILEYSLVKIWLNKGIEQIGLDNKENDIQAIYFHQRLTALREDILICSEAFFNPFEGCNTLSKYLQNTLRDENKFRSFVFAMHSTERTIGKMTYKHRMMWSHNRKPNLIVLERHKFFERALQIEDDSELGKIYLEFCNHWCRVVMDFYNKRENRTYSKPAPLRTTNNRDYMRVINIANMLVICRCALRYDPCEL